MFINEERCLDIQFTYNTSQQSGSEQHWLNQWFEFGAGLSVLPTNGRCSEHSGNLLKNGDNFCNLATLVEILDKFQMTSYLFLFTCANTARVPSKLFLLFCILSKAEVSQWFVSVSSMGVIASQVMMETLHGQVKFQNDCFWKKEIAFCFYFFFPLELLFSSDVICVSSKYKHVSIHKDNMECGL